MRSWTVDTSDKEEEEAAAAAELDRVRLIR